MIARYAVLIAIALGLWAGPAPAQPAGDAPPKIIETKVARDVVNGEPVAPGDTFAPDAGKIVVWYRVAAHDAPVPLRGIWHYLGGSRDRVIVESESVLPADQDRGDFALELPPGKPWPTGAYRLDILIANRPAASVPFRVADPSAVAPAQPSAKAPVPSIGPGTASLPPPAAPAAGITVDDVATLLRQLGHAPAQITHEGQPVLVTEIGQYRLLLMFAGCTAGACERIHFHAAFTSARPITPATIDAWNAARSPLTALLDRDGDPAVFSNLALSGASLDAVRDMIATWRDQLPRFIAHLATQR